MNHKISLIILFLIAFFLFFQLDYQVARAQTTPTPIDYHLPFPGILPDHPLYPMKRIRDWLLLFFNRNPIKKTEYHLLFADKKLVMAQLLLDKRKTDLSVNTLIESQTELLKSVSVFNTLASSSNPPENFSDKIELAIKKHSDLINKIDFSITDLNQKKIIRQALGINQQALNQISSLK
ncbi:hypothetical protein A3D05_02545 [Candidatus Gottesmanbacteria bacterium RIFCSPHIGHO2_02_FULL_40_24]|uniref:DUF5667 domain-containing protein n=1 Tax=Candidatus Gottesmanbacteria bacterium RIFCSPHIGHO2_01_FULL_40_15 TaxID=1798376 RepID=A0A1F5Z689_9BACT|nr:MAG: hypothetical protein A2777_00550 [Candidatus Gottesmanbacteria bacterium RIFCSPHIGHO2_01_FULL_40_15]OGG18729.1 MAG: hypothetical protein A3D05_02545 [Candidatus Gottesmanbacteria bacterium RIFCSPHIGHO2_02_FULL_40_24]OGG20918.1 MAG: hypothetical protein A3B48_05960 [Candidatus Gottesmanbacteria bacterium RIFCSPLOWO2_01_FULL_40_10]OGG23020.1 MAG: hypothetical protein A3E42_06755 [Candidatus Gottesmanbacteria bacterium RIFCSPHIGHO2_12_FULL_40_13]OGG31939.1 MAG: hypothetical protein A3I80_0